LYDKDGNFLGWFSSMAKSYDKKEDCFVEQFNNYPIDKNTNKKIEVYCLLYVLNYFTEDLFDLSFINVYVCVRGRGRYVLERVKSSLFY